VRIGNEFFRSGQNASANPAVDTVAAGDTVTWTWVNTGGVEHSVQSLGAPGFPSSVILAGRGKTYQAVFLTPGTERCSSVARCGSCQTG
jgi:plastocyanin